MDVNKKNFLALLCAYVKQENSVIIDNNVDFNKIYELSTIHNLQGVVYTMLNKINKSVDQEIYEKFRKDFLFTVQNSLKQETAMKNIIAVLNKNKIKHVLFKGFILRDYYPVKETRTMGDIDFLINIADRKKTDEILKSLGFKFCKNESDALVWNYINKYVYLEVHTSIVHQMTFSGIDYAKYFNNVFENITLIKQFTYEISKEYHFIYLLVHLAKHFYHIGAGIRMFLDLSIFSKHFENNLNWNYVENEIQKLNLSKFASKVFFICNNLLGGSIPIFNEYNFNKEDYEVVEYILNIGVFGHNRDDENYYDLSFGSTLSDRNGINKYVSKVKMLLRLVFPTPSTLLSVGQSIWELPLTWIKRCRKIIFTNRSLLINQLKGVFVTSDEAKTHAIMLKKLGLQ